MHAERIGIYSSSLTKDICSLWQKQEKFYF